MDALVPPSSRLRVPGLSTPCQSAQLLCRSGGHLSRLPGLFRLRPHRARLQSAETMGGGLRDDLGLGPMVDRERPMRAGAHEHRQAVMAGRFASRGA